MDNQDRKPVDLAQFVTTPMLRETLIADLKEPNDWSCLMLKTPLKLVEKSYLTPALMWSLLAFVYGNLTLIFFPGKSVKHHLL